MGGFVCFQDAPRGARGASLLAFMFVSGCAMIGPDFRPAEAPVAQEWEKSEGEILKNETADYSNGWKVFDDPVLDSLTQTAYEQNLSLQISGLRVLQARTQFGVVTGDLCPQLQEMTSD